MSVTVLKPYGLKVISILIWLGDLVQLRHNIRKIATSGKNLSAALDVAKNFVNKLCHVVGWQEIFSKLTSKDFCLTDSSFDTDDLLPCSGLVLDNAQGYLGDNLLKSDNNVNKIFSSCCNSIHTAHVLGG